MSLLTVAWRSIQQRSLASILTAISMALGVTLVVAVLVLHGGIKRSFENNGLGYNMVVGAKGGRLELVLNSVYYLSRPIENIPYTYYKEFTAGKYHNYTGVAVPVCLGDYYKEFRVVGTTPDMFEKLVHGGQKYEFEPGGRNFRQDEFYGAVIGSTVAREAGLRVGSEFQPTHGAGPEGHVHDAFKIVGVLKPSGTPNDRALFINMEGFFLIPDHAKPEDEDAATPVKPAVHDEHAHEHEEDHAHEHGDHDHMHADDAHDHAHDDHDHDHDAAPSGKAAAATKPAKADDHDHDHGDHAADKHVVDKHADEHDHHEAAADHDHAGHDHDHAAEHGHEHAEEHAHDHEHGHDHAHSHEPLPESQREVTAILLLTKSPGGAPPELVAPALEKQINKDSVAQAVSPIREMSGIFQTFVDPVLLLLLSLTVLIVIVSGISILVSIYNSMNDRRHEIAVMRALGAQRGTVMLIVLLESILLSLGGGLLGWLLGHLLIAGLSPWIVENTGVSIGFLRFVSYELVIIPGLILLASLVGYLPAAAAYRTDVAKALSAAP